MLMVARKCQIDGEGEPPEFRREGEGGWTNKDDLFALYAERVQLKEKNPPPDPESGGTGGSDPV
jgi:hypothetical protein